MSRERFLQATRVWTVATFNRLSRTHHLWFAMNVPTVGIVKLLAFRSHGNRLCWRNGCRFAVFRAEGWDRGGHLAQKNDESRNRNTGENPEPLRHIQPSEEWLRYSGSFFQPTSME